MLKLTKTFSTTAVILALLTACDKHSPQALEITEAYVRAPVPGQTVGAGFLSLRNNSAQDITLVAVRSPAANNAEIHEHRHDNGTMRMRQLKTLNIKAGDSANFKPGGLHIMLFGMQETLPESTEIIFSSSDGREFSTKAGITRP